jgi:hypothetical protein
VRDEFASPYKTAIGLKLLVLMLQALGFKIEDMKMNDCDLTGSYRSPNFISFYLLEGSV